MRPALARDLCRALMKRHGLHEWQFRFDHARRRFGSCIIARRLITLSKPLTMLNDESQVRDTILHEIAHALTPGDGHGAKWKAMCVAIGAQPRRCFTEDVVITPPRRPPRWEFGCRACGWWVQRRRRTRRRYVCAKCRGSLAYRERFSSDHVRAGSTAAASSAGV